MACLNDEISRMFLMFVGRLFHSRGPTTEKARSPNFVRVREISYWLVAAKRSMRWPWNDGILPICWIIDSSPSKMMSRSRTECTGSMTTEPSLRLVSSWLSLVRFDREPNHISSVLSGLSWECLWATGVVRLKPINFVSLEPKPLAPYVDKNVVVDSI